MNQYLVRVVESLEKQYTVEVYADTVSVAENGYLQFNRKIGTTPLLGSLGGTYRYDQVAAFNTWVYYKLIVEEL